MRRRQAHLRARRLTVRNTPDIPVFISIYILDKMDPNGRSCCLTFSVIATGSSVRRTGIRWEFSPSQDFTIQKLLVDDDDTASPTSQRTLPRYRQANIRHGYSAHNAPSPEPVPRPFRTPPPVLDSPGRTLETLSHSRRRQRSLGKGSLCSRRRGSNAANRMDFQHHR
jgi:hypothetical protein